MRKYIYTDEEYRNTLKTETSKKNFDKLMENEEYLNELKVMLKLLGIKKEKSKRCLKNFGFMMFEQGWNYANNNKKIINLCLPKMRNT